MVAQTKLHIVVYAISMLISGVFTSSTAKAACTLPVGTTSANWACVDISLNPPSFFSAIEGVQFQINNTLTPVLVESLNINEAAVFDFFLPNATTNNVKVVGAMLNGSFAAGTSPLFSFTYTLSPAAYPLFTVDPVNLVFVPMAVTPDNLVLNTTYVLDNGATTILNGYPLPVTITGSGSGTVVSSPAGISCSSGTCDYPFTLGTAVVLTASPAGSSQVSSTPSYRSGWTGCSSSTDSSCTISSLTTGSTASALFSLYPTKLSGQGTYYANLQVAADNAASGSTIQAVSSSSISGGLVLSANKALTITGGYDETFTIAGTTPTTLTGTMTIASGSLIIDKLAIF